MRSALVCSLLLLGLALAGCSDDDNGDDVHVQCADGTELHADDYNVTTEEELMAFCPGVTPTVPTPSANRLPTIVLTVRNATGAEANFTVAPGSLTFSAERSTDADGTVDAVAAVVETGNGTRVLSIRKDGKDTPQTVAFERPGVFNVTVTGIDDRAGFATIQTQVFLNAVFNKTKDFPSFLPADVVTGAESPCVGPIEANDPSGDPNPVDPQYFSREGFELAGNASFVEASIVSGTGLIAICGPDGAVLSDQGTAVESNNEGPLAPATATAGYYVGVYSTAPAAPGAANSVQVTITVHYEPRAA